MFENSFLAMFISQVSSKLRDKHCQIIRISILIFKHCFMGQYIELVIILPYSVPSVLFKCCFCHRCFYTPSWWCNFSKLDTFLPHKGRQTLSVTTMFPQIGSYFLPEIIFLRTLGVHIIFCTIWTTFIL